MRENSTYLTLFSCHPHILTILASLEPGIILEREYALSDGEGVSYARIYVRHCLPFLKTTRDGRYRAAPSTSARKRQERTSPTHCRLVPGKVNSQRPQARLGRACPDICGASCRLPSPRRLQRASHQYVSSGSSLSGPPPSPLHSSCLLFSFTSLKHIPTLRLRDWQDRRPLRRDLPRAFDVRLRCSRHRLSSEQGRPPLGSAVRHAVRSPRQAQQCPRDENLGDRARDCPCHEGETEVAFVRRNVATGKVRPPSGFVLRAREGGSADYRAVRRSSELVLRTSRRQRRASSELEDGWAGFALS